jgi:uroporphyrinogen decarboxylase
MNACERFLATLRFDEPDRVPHYDQSVREDTLERWHREGLPRDVSVEEFFELDHWELFGPREDVSLNLYRIPEFEGELKTRSDFERLKRSYDPTTPERYPHDWDDHVRRWRDRDYPVGITAWRGFFQSLAVGDWQSLLNLLYMIHDAPGLLTEMVEFLADFTLALIEKALCEVEFDYAILDEPIASHHAPVIAPASFYRFVIPAYRRIVNRLRAAGIEVIIFDTHGAVKPLIPLCLEAGVNALGCGAARASGVDYVELRREFGRDLLLIGGLDERVLEQDRRAIEEEILSQVPSLLEQGGYVPLVDGRVRSWVPFENYVYYRELIKELSTR